MKNKKLALTILPEKLAICHFEKNAPFPDWALKESAFSSVTRTNDELSVVFPQDKVPAGVLAEKNWRAFKTIGLNVFSIGVIAALSKPLAEAGISIFNVSTYETDYLLIEEKNLERAKKILSAFCSVKEK